MSAEQSLRVAFDTGGTFTDVLIAARDGRLFAYKILTLPDSIGADVNRCVDAAMEASPGTSVDGIVHGTTIASNAVRIEIAQRMAGHSNAKTTGLYDRCNDDTSVGEVERFGN